MTCSITDTDKSVYSVNPDQTETALEEKSDQKLHFLLIQHYLLNT